MVARTRMARLVLWCLMMRGSLQGRKECCPHIEISSEGEAAGHQPQRLGVYTARDRGWADRPIYKHRDSQDFLFYLQTKSKGLWMVGPKIGNFDGGLASPADNICPHDVGQGQWRFTDGRVWRKDQKIRVKCLHDYKPEEEENQNEVNGKFKIMNLKWDDRLRNPKSLKYKTLANTIEGDIMSMLTEKDDLSHQADFKVSVERFKKGSVIVNFKIDYSLKHAVLAIPFKLNPENITDTLAKDFQYQNGILFSRFAIAADSFNGTVFRDQCSVRGCSHKCSYDYDVEDYLCTCPRTLLLNSDNKTCDQSPSQQTTANSLQLISTTLGPSTSVTGESVPLPNITTEREELETTDQSDKEESTEITPSGKITENDDDGTTNSIEDKITDITSQPSITTTAFQLVSQNTEQSSGPILVTSDEVTTSTAHFISTQPPFSTPASTEALVEEEEASGQILETTTDVTASTASTFVLTEDPRPMSTTDTSDTSDIGDIDTEVETEPNLSTTELAQSEEIESTTIIDYLDDEEENEEESADYDSSTEEVDSFVLELTTEPGRIRDEGATADLISTTVPPTTSQEEQESETELSTETAGQISMEVTDDHNAIIDISGVYKLVCSVKEKDKIDLNCEEQEGSGRRVHLLIDKENVRGDISRIWEDNVRLIVDSLLVEDISPK